MKQFTVNELLLPISPERPGGEDCAYSPECDEIRKLRKGDEPGLSQGEWVRDIAPPQWPKVMALCETLLTVRSKDLQVACWLTEALTHLKGFEGLSFGMQVVSGILSRFWETGYPALDPKDLEERIAKIEWLNAQLPLTIQRVPMTAANAHGYSYLKWEESRTVENLGLKDPKAKEDAIADGKLPGEAFDKSVTASGQAFYRNLHAQLQEALGSLKGLEQEVDRRFGQDSPGLDGVRGAMEGCLELSGQILKRFGIKPAAAVSPSAETVNLDVPAAGHAVVAPGQRAASRTEAIRQLREIARFFHDNEPQSPVAALVERAARWAEMPLDQWLADVIKDEATLNQLRELLDLDQNS